MRRGLRAAALVMALVLLLGTVAAATDTTETTGSIYDAANVAKKNGIQVAPLDSQNCKVEFKDNSSEALTVTYENKDLNVDDMVIVLLLKSDKAVTSDTEANGVATTLTAGTIQYIDQVDVTREDHTISFDIFPQNYSNGVIRLIWKSPDSGGVNTATVAAVNRTYTLGDVNRNGSIDIMDVGAVLLYVAYPDNDVYNDIDIQAANVNGDLTTDGKPRIDIMDVSAILLYVAYGTPFTQSN